MKFVDEFRDPGVITKAAEEIRRRDALRGHGAFGRIAEHEKRFDAAAREYENARREFPDSPEPLLWRARMAERQKDYETAWRTVMDVNPFPAIMGRVSCP